MSNQSLALLAAANGNAVGAGQQWFGGAGKLYASANGSFGVRIEVSVDGGTTWLLDQQVSVASTDGAIANFANPPLLVRAVGQGGGSPQNLNVTLVSA